MKSRATRASSRGLLLGVASAIVVAAVAVAADEALTIGVPSSGPHRNPPDFCAYAVLSGHLASGEAGVKVELFARPYPFTGGFDDTGLSATTNPAGDYSINVTPRVLTDYHVVASTSPQVQSADFRERARTCATVHASDATPKRGQLVRFFGTVRPAKDGRRIALFGPGGKLAATTLMHNNTESSKFGLTVRVGKSGRYGVEIRADAANDLGGGGINIRVHR